MLPAGTPPGNPIHRSVLSRATQLGVGWHQGYLWQNWDPHACLPPPLVPHLTKIRPCCHEPQGQFSIPSISCRAREASASPSASLPQSPSMPRQALGCDLRSLATGDTTLGRRDTLPQRHDPLLLPAVPRVQPVWQSPLAPAQEGRLASRVRLCQRRAGFGQDPSSCPGARFSQKNGSPRALVSWATGLSRSQCREEPPAPPGSPPAARWKTTVHFVLSQATKRTGEIPNFSSGATVPVTLFRGWQARAPLCPRGLLILG